VDRRVAKISSSMLCLRMELRDVETGLRTLLEAWRFLSIYKLVLFLEGLILHCGGSNTVALVYLAVGLDLAAHKVF
jgi:hypothetical protein